MLSYIVQEITQDTQYTVQRNEPTTLGTQSQSNLLLTNAAKLIHLVVR
jgi:hypothetical protein